ncbi:uncharacterized protein H6S33_001528 [Morchella sextelata]|uniref:uncharacterized protein n=1 Tax=Morchella sextelata TaxID=1174677 RepID=UPI001D043D90|nr:uncharacterized protein H6S33_001528 [Morchella sextelata]KAH0608394.1 hypothetical protein H6S33_001528 [Morchella sextelata]
MRLAGLIYTRVSTGLLLRTPTSPNPAILTCLRALSLLSSSAAAAASPHQHHHQHHHHHRLHRLFSSTPPNRKVKLNAALAYKLFHYRRKKAIYKMLAIKIDPQTDVVLQGKYPAKAHAKRVAEFMGLKEGLLYLESAKEMLLEDCDSEAPFRQRRYFYYLSGCDLPDSYLTYNVSSQTLTLYIPPISPSSVLWSGLPVSISEAKSLYDVDEVRHTTPDLHKDLLASSHPIFGIECQLSPKLPEQIRTSIDTNGSLKTAIEECRAIKDAYEVALIRRANEITATAHHRAMNLVKSSVNERELEAVFTERCIAGGAPKQAYHGIFASGRSAATLHYVKNNVTLAGKLNLLLDAGAEYNNYASDVTRTFPINGEFTKESQQIYDLVLKMQKETIEATKAGTRWDDVHILAHRIAIEGLLALGILKDGSVDEILESRTSCAFLPHGLGHMLGMDTHDTGGHPNYDDEDKMFCYLRKRGPLRVGEVITVEPGIYFCEFIINPFLEDPKHSKYIDKDVLDKYWDVGGVRIEDNILITETGNENLTTTVKEVEDMYKLINDL